MLSEAAVVCSVADSLGSTVMTVPVGSGSAGVVEGVTSRTVGEGAALVGLGVGALVADALAVGVLLGASALVVGVASGVSVLVFADPQAVSRASRAAARGRVRAFI